MMRPQTVPDSQRASNHNYSLASIAAGCARQFPTAARMMKAKALTPTHTQNMKVCALHPLERSSGMDRFMALIVAPSPFSLQTATAACRVISRPTRHAVPSVWRSIVPSSFLPRPSLRLAHLCAEIHMGSSGSYLKIANHETPDTAARRFAIIGSPPQI